MNRVRFGGGALPQGGPLRRFNVDGTGVFAVAAVLMVTGLALYLYAKRKQIGAAVNITSDQNLAYKGVNAVGAAVTGDTSFSLGSWLYDLTHKASDINSPVILNQAPVDAVNAGTSLGDPMAADRPLLI